MRAWAGVGMALALALIPATALAAGTAGREGSALVFRGSDRADSLVVELYGRGGRKRTDEFYV